MQQMGRPRDAAVMHSHAGNRRCNTAKQCTLGKPHEAAGEVITAQVDCQSHTCRVTCILPVSFDTLQLWDVERNVTRQKSWLESTGECVVHQHQVLDGS